MDKETLDKINSILNKEPKKTKEEIKNQLINNHSFINLEKIISFVKDKKEAKLIYDELKLDLPEFYLIIYKNNAIKCGWSSELNEEETRFYCKKLDEYFLLSKNKIHFTLVNQKEKFKEKVLEQITNIKNECSKND